MKAIIRLFLMLSIALVPAMAASAQGELKPKGTKSTPKPTPKRIPGEKEYKAAHKYFNENHFSYGMGELEQAAELGNLKAKQELGLMYQYGIGCEQSYPMAIKWYEECNSKDFYYKLLISAQELLGGDQREVLNMFKGNNYTEYYIYFPINQYQLKPQDKFILDYVSDLIKSNRNSKCTITGWKENFTGTAETNDALRRKRVNAVADYLMTKGVNKSQLESMIDSRNLTDFGYAGAPFERAVTILIED